MLVRVATKLAWRAPNCALLFQALGIKPHGQFLFCFVWVGLCTFFTSFQNFYRLILWISESNTFQKALVQACINLLTVQLVQRKQTLHVFKGPIPNRINFVFIAFQQPTLSERYDSGFGPRFQVLTIKIFQYDTKIYNSMIRQTPVNNFTIDVKNAVLLLCGCQVHRKYKIDFTVTIFGIIPRELRTPKITIPQLQTILIHNPHQRSPPRVYIMVHHRSFHLLTNSHTTRRLTAHARVEITSQQCWRGGSATR